MGSSLLEFTIVFPVLTLVALGTVDVGFMLYDWVLANSAAYVGAHKAILFDPVASNITNPSYNPAVLGEPCFYPATGQPNGNCPSDQVMKVTCTPSATVGAGFCCLPSDVSGVTGVCTTASSPYNYVDTPFSTYIFPAMLARFPRLQRQNVTISYQIDNLGFAGRAGGLPMTVTVTIQGIQHQFFFLGGLMNAFGSGFASFSNLPPFTTALTSEDVATN
jgi:hypothetical protein